MTDRVLRAVCPACGGAVRVRPDGTVAQHTRADQLVRGHRCRLSGDALPHESVRAWLADYEREAIEAVQRARAALTRAEAAMAEAEHERTARAAWCADQRGNQGGCDVG